MTMNKWFYTFNKLLYALSNSSCQCASLTYDGDILPYHSSG
ncbi:putative surface antigen protein [Pectobacterium atrosepticum SCRI1043]|uniref:Surface antigen protein n=1 Tax=Pectobacterium atrosepticum (strain SCRI 1043 / ATCC BAA-672) TaxID=218491 RepID=Q6D5L8_PECAS|nr:putative surface antigen protein [Pectobacterium atrosepticum SCRI1043]